MYIYLLLGMESCPLRYIEVLCCRWVYLQPWKDASFACWSDCVVGVPPKHPTVIYAERGILFFPSVSVGYSIFLVPFCYSSVLTLELGRPKKDGRLAGHVYLDTST